MGKGALRTLLVALTAALLLGCASSGERREQEAHSSTGVPEDDEATCRESGDPGSVAFETCRNRLAIKRSEQQHIEAKRQEDFNRSLGEGTSGLSDQ